MALSEKRVLHGILIVNLSDQAESEVLFDKVEAALAEMEKAAPWRIATVRHGVRRILIVQQPGSSYWGFVRACALSAVTLERQRPEWVASVILHEAIHGRFDRQGIRYEGPCRSRIEQVCLKHQLLLLSRMQGTQDLTEHLLQHSGGEWHSDAGRHRATVAKLTALGAPEWVVNLLANRRPE